MDAYFASVEQLDDPGLKGKCVIVGGLSKRGVVSAASYEARKFGVHSATPMFQARQKCPQGIFVRPRMKRYQELSEKIMDLLRDFSPLVEQVSVDEAYVDITGCERLHGSPEEIAVSIKKQIMDKVNLTCSVGIAPNKFLAKIASDMDKPDGLTIIMPDKAQQFIETLPVRKVPGVGKTTGTQLEQMDIKTLGDVNKYPEEILLNRLGKYGQRLIDISNCIDDSPVTTKREHKSVSSEETLAEDTDDKSLLGSYILEQSEDVGRQLRELGKRARTITLKIKHADFKQVTRSVTVATPTQSSEIIYQEALRLLEAYRINKKVRLIGVGTSGFVPGTIPIQMDLFGDTKKRIPGWEKVDRTVDSITKKFGKDVIGKATLRKNG